ncbi:MULTISPECIES: AI-2E family transporter [Laceyella]|uniref:Predicted PurR-regulated permease PerM n=2 Tax=Laceyella TaxID=292635 RepID=A0AA46ACK1_9BACL|nr:MULTISPECIES: AI-2E family transporter [Laceyella]MRG27169.1 AI-2E family transporter [Laceyella tengchongensis]PRZ12402.1 putative PurR-regulated permease PerM [Laceyella sediminis]SMP00247.1 Predicted PurR-regulated permease PerM [Laceyella tengchongensis]
MPQSKLFRLGYGMIMVLLIILLANKVKFIFQPLVILVQTLFFPFLVSGVLFYLFRPVVRFLEKRGIPRGLGILLIYVVVLGLLVLVGFLIGPLLKEQFNRLLANFPQMIDSVQTQLINWSHHPWVASYIDWNQVATAASNYLRSSISTIGTNIANFFSVITNIILVFVTVPFILYYMLKEGERFPSYLLRLLPEKERQQGLRILGDMDFALSSYIKGQVLVSLLVGVLVYIGYLIIGLDYSLILALVTMFTNVIPLVGPFIGTIPAVIVALIDSPMMVVWVLVVAFVAQQLEGNLVSPYVMGKSLDVHPLTIILLLLVAGSLGGFLGLLLAVPTYAVLKVVVSHLYRLVRLRAMSKQEES